MSDDSQDIKLARLEERYKAQHEALAIARDEMNRRLENMNEFRAQILQERGEFVRKDWFEKVHQDSLNDINEQKNWQSNMNGRLWMLGAILTIAVVIINILFRYWPK